MAPRRDFNCVGFICEKVAKVQQVFAMWARSLLAIA